MRSGGHEEKGNRKRAEGGELENTGKKGFSVNPEARLEKVRKKEAQIS